jgi:UDP-3-O-[3-hydroxymyristoyl] glucosamine N-acyltransferase
MSGTLLVTKELLGAFIAERKISSVGDIEVGNKISGIKPLGLAKLDDAAFCRFEGQEGLDYIESSKAGLIFIPESLKNNVVEKDRLLLPCKVPRLEMLRFISRFWSEADQGFNLTNNPSVHELAVIGSDVIIGPFSVIGAGVVVGQGSRIGANCHVENAVIGSNVKIASSVTIGGAGYGFEDDPVTGEHLDFPHIGGVKIGNDVSIGSSTCIDRGSIGDTVIGDESKIDNLVHIAHNVNIGKRCKIIALSIVGGSVDIGDDSWISPGSVIRDWRSIGKGALVGLGSVVTKDVEEGAVVIGNPAKPFQRTAHRYK